jgi:hypothetical protein
VRKQRYRYHYSHHDAPNLRVASVFISSSGLRPNPRGFNLSTLQCNLNATWSARPVSARRVMLEANRGTRPVQARSILASPHLPCVTLIRCCIHWSLYTPRNYSWNYYSFEAYIEAQRNIFGHFFTVKSGVYSGNQAYLPSIFTKLFPHPCK